MLQRLNYILDDVGLVFIDRHPLPQTLCNSDLGVSGVTGRALSWSLVSFFGVLE